MKRGRATFANARRLLILVALAIGGWLIASGLWIPAKAMMAQVLLARAWDEARATGEAVKPWPWADVAAVARLSVPRLGVSGVVLGQPSGEALAFGPGHVTGTAAPNAPGLSVLAGHRDTHFAFLKNLRPGDLVRLESRDGFSRDYRVMEARIVDARRWRSPLEPTPRAEGEEGPPPARLALATCWPLDGTTRTDERLLVFAEPVA